MRKRVIKVLIVDDSAVARETISRGLQIDSSIAVVGTASDPYEARDKIAELEPDVLTLDITMPKMNGIDFLKRLMAQYPLPVVVISSSARSVLDALEAGAVDFITKPDIRTPDDLTKFMQEIVYKVKVAASATLKPVVDQAGAPASEQVVRHTSTAIKVIALGASTGGTEALLALLKGLPSNVPGIVIAQHMPPVFTTRFAERLNASTAFEVKEAQSGDKITPGTVLLAPGNFQMKVVGNKSGLRVECEDEGQKVNGHCPAVDVLFESVAQSAAPHAIGVILTGMGHDGAKGLLSMRRRGCLTIGQDEASSVVYGMPKVAFGIGAVEKQCALGLIPSVIVNLLYPPRNVR
jgi:two-component system chemotaxis response regulator CheB